MAIVRTLIILALVGLILGGSAFFAYELYWKPRKLDMEDKASQGPAAMRDYTLPAFEKAAGIQRTGQIDGARAAWVEFIRNYPDSPKIAEAKAALGSINTGQVFSPVPSPEKTSYAVSKGDSLVKIAAKFKSNAELIFRVNNLQTINLKIGQQLVIPQLDMSIVVDRKARTVTLLNRGQFFKEYQAVALKTPGVQLPLRQRWRTRSPYRVRIVWHSGTRIILAASAGSCSAPAASPSGAFPKAPGPLRLPESLSLSRTSRKFFCSSPAELPSPFSKPS